MQKAVSDSTEYTIILIVDGNSICVKTPHHMKDFIKGFIFKLQWTLAHPFAVNEIQKVTIRKYLQVRNIALKRIVKFNRTSLDNEVRLLRIHGIHVGVR